MSILVDGDILLAVKLGDIVIEPFDETALGTNSYDVHLAPTMRVYAEMFDGKGYVPRPLDVLEPRATEDVDIPDEGYVLKPCELYLASTIEYTESNKHVPVINGKSSLGRLGLSIHVTAGFGDVGFKNHWTLEMTVVKPLRVYAGMPVAQLCWHEISRAPTTPYGRKASAKYARRDAKPGASAMHLNRGKWRDRVGRRMEMPQDLVDASPPKDDRNDAEEGPEGEDLRPGVSRR